jgi:putative copper export protein
LFGGSLLIFLVTGTHLMMINEDYLGLGNFFGNSWSILIIVKHVLVVAFLALAIVAERNYVGKISDDKPEILQRYRLSLYGNMALGMLIILLTSIAQAL